MGGDKGATDLAGQFLMEQVNDLHLPLREGALSEATTRAERLTALAAGRRDGPKAEDSVMLFVDLDAGFAIGDEYGFRELHALQPGPSVFLRPLQEAFVTIDPVVGYATIAEPATLPLLGLAAVCLRPVALRRQFRTVLRHEWDLQ